VVAFVDHAAVLGGGEIALSNLVERLDRACWQPLVILGGEGPLVERLNASGVEVEILSLAGRLTQVHQDAIGAPSMIHPLRTIAAVRYVIRLALRLRKRRPALLHANSLRACVLGGLAGRLAGIPVVWQIHSVVSEPMMTAAAVRLMRWMARWLPDRIICNSNATAACFTGVGDRVRIIACGSDTTRYTSNGRGSGAPRVGMIARFSPLKGQHVFVEAAKQISRDHPDTEFVLAGAPLFGEDAYADRVRGDANASVNAGRFQFLGFIDDVPSLLRELDIVVQPSVYPEGFGQSVLEAMMAGKAVVASAAGGLQELVEDRVTGRLVRPDDPSALRQAVNELLTDPAAAREMGRRARLRACELYDIRETVRSIEGVYAEVARG
jgi:glycosyltransferase involved in cell wall biosynthesis